MSIGGIQNLDYTVILCARLPETRAFYRDVIGFPIETDLENWVSFRVGATLLTLRPRGSWSVCDDGPLPAGSAAMQLAFRVPLPAVDQCHAELVSKGVTILRSRLTFRSGGIARCSSVTPRTTSSRFTLSFDQPLTTQLGPWLPIHRSHGDAIYSLTGLGKRMAASKVRMRQGRSDDVPALQAISAEARERYRSFPELSHVAGSAPVAAERFAIGDAVVAYVDGDDSPVGFALTRTLDEHLFLDNISVATHATGLRIGAELLGHVVRLASEAALPRVILTTFRRPPWNGPWFRRHGFETMPAADYGPGLRAVLSQQGKHFDPTTREVLWCLSR